MYAQGLPPDVRLRTLTIDGRLPFVFEASGSETHFTNGYDPEPQHDACSASPGPKPSQRILRDAEAAPDTPQFCRESDLFHVAHQGLCGKSNVEGLLTGRPGLLPELTHDKGLVDGDEAPGDDAGLTRQQTPSRRPSGAACS
jgi:hypothetical protein